MKGTMSFGLREIARVAYVKYRNELVEWRDEALDTKSKILCGETESFDLCTMPETHSAIGIDPELVLEMELLRAEIRSLRCRPEEVKQMEMF